MMAVETWTAELAWSVHLGPMGSACARGSRPGMSIPEIRAQGYSSQYLWNISKASLTAASHPANACWAPASRLSPALVRWQSHGATYLLTDTWPWANRSQASSCSTTLEVTGFCSKLRVYSCVDTCRILPLACGCQVPSAWGGGMVFQLWIALLEPTQESKADLAHAEVLTHHLPLQRWRREGFTPGKTHVLSCSDQLQCKPPFSVCSVTVRQHTQSGAPQYCWTITSWKPDTQTPWESPPSKLLFYHP